MIFIIAGFFLGLFLGSLILCLASRSLTNESFWGRSYCDHCKKSLRWYDLIPVLSYLFNKGRCSQCHYKIPIEYPIWEVLIGLIYTSLFYFIFVASNITFSYLAGLPRLDLLLVILSLLFKIYIVAVFAILFITDLKKYLIPNRITYPAMIVTLTYLVVDALLKIYVLYIYLVNSPVGKYLLPPHSQFFYLHVLDIIEPLNYGLISAFSAALFFGLLIIVTKGRGMGGGDLKLAFLMGLVLGFPNILIAIMLSFVLGSIYGILLIILKIKKFGQVIPFGPFLSIGSLIALFVGDKIFNWYLTLKIY